MNFFYIWYMRKSERIFNFEMEERDGKVLLTTKEWPYSVLQVVPTTPETYNEVVEGCSMVYWCLRMLWRKRLFFIILMLFCHSFWLWQNNIFSTLQHALKAKMPIAARPEGAEALSPGHRPGYEVSQNAPYKGKSFKIHIIKMVNQLRYVKLLP